MIGNLRHRPWLVPFGVFGVVLVVLASWAVARGIRNHRIAGPRGGTLPPLPPRTRA